MTRPRTAIVAALLVMLPLAARADTPKPADIPPAVVEQPATANPASRHVTPPRPAGIHSADGFYPPEAMRLGLQGQVIVGFLIRTDGTVSDVTVTKSSNNALLDAAAVAAATTWHYLPAMLDGKPVEFRWQATLVFKLRQDQPTIPIYTIVQAPADAYPSDARAQKQQGFTGVAVTLDEVGRVLAAEVSASSGVPSLDDASLDLVKRRWHFSPATVDGKPLKTLLLIVVTWSLP